MTVAEQVLREAPFSMAQLAEDAGLSYAMLRSWRIGRKRARPQDLARIADALRRKSDQLARHADLLERAARERINQDL